MRYLGGKARIGKQLVAYLESVRKPGQAWVEPFCGGLWVTYLASGTRLASDANKALITLYSHMQKGWVPPEVLSEDRYQEIKAKKDDADPLTAFAGFGCSFGGKWFGGYARNAQKSNYCAIAKRSITKKNGAV